MNAVREDDAGHTLHLEHEPVIALAVLQQDDSTTAAVTRGVTRVIANQVDRSRSKVTRLRPGVRLAEPDSPRTLSERSRRRKVRPLRDSPYQHESQPGLSTVGSPKHRLGARTDVIICTSIRISINTGTDIAIDTGCGSNTSAVDAPRNCSTHAQRAVGRTGADGTHIAQWPEFESSSTGTSTGGR